MSSTDPIPNVGPFPHLQELLQAVQHDEPKGSIPASIPSRNPAQASVQSGQFGLLNLIAQHLASPATVDASEKKAESLGVSDSQPVDSAAFVSPPPQVEAALAIGQAPEPNSTEEIPNLDLERVETQSVACGEEEFPPDGGGHDNDLSEERQDHSVPAEVEHDEFHEPLGLMQLVSKSSARELDPQALIAPLPHALSEVAESSESQLESRGLGLLLGGAGLVVLAILAACLVSPPAAAAFRHWRDAGHSDPWLTRTAWAMAAFFGLVSAGLLSAGLGSLRQRRWSVPIIHAGAWFIVMGVLMALAVASAFYFFIAPPDRGAESQDTLGAIGRGLVVAGIFGVVLPLVYIAIYQRGHVAAVCARVDRNPRWTDPLGEPLLMLWLACLLVAAGLAALLLHQGAFPLCGKVLVGLPAKLATAVCLVSSLAAAWLAAHRRKLGWWLSLLLFTLMAASGIWTFLQVPWSAFAQPLGVPASAGEAAPSKLAAMVVAAGFAPLAMVLLMSRGSFPTDDEAGHHAQTIH